MRGLLLVPPFAIGVALASVALSASSPEAAPLNPPEKPSVLVGTQYNDVFMDRKTGCQYIWVYGGLIRRDGTTCKKPD